MFLFKIRGFIRICRGEGGRTCLHNSSEDHVPAKSKSVVWILDLTCFEDEGGNARTANEELDRNTAETFDDFTFKYVNIGLLWLQ